MYREDDLNYCRKIIKSNSKSFYKAFSRLPKEKSNAIFSVYAFCRYVDDIADTEGNASALKEFKNELDLFAEGRTVDKPIWRLLKEVFSNYDMEIYSFYDMIQGQFLDINFSNIQTQDQLEKYCYYVAGTVGLMITPILATKNHYLLRETAIKLGMAMQITNILRDIGEDLKRNRVYIPSEVMGNYNYNYNHLKNHIINDSFINLWEAEALIAENMYDEVVDKITLFDRDSQLSVLLATNFYRGILNSVRKNKYQCFSNRSYVSAFKKLQIAIKTLVNLIKGRFNQTHDKEVYSSE